MNFFVENWVLFLAALTSGALLIWPLVKAGAPGGDKVSTAQAVQLINREKATLIDICEPAEYLAGHAAGARSIPLSGLEGSGALPKNKTLPLVVVCQTGARSGRAVAVLKKLGYANAKVLSGGLGAWREANLPIERQA